MCRGAGSEGAAGNSFANKACAIAAPAPAVNGDNTHTHTHEIRRFAICKYLKGHADKGLLRGILSDFRAGP